MKVFSAGDALEIAQASSAMFNGKITGIEIASALGTEAENVPEAWYKKAEIFKNHPGKINGWI